MADKTTYGRPSCSACNGSGSVGSALCVRCPDVTEQARDWLLLKCPASVSGSGGHNAAFTAACAIVCGFQMPEGVAMQLIQEWNSRCAPPWSERELRHKLSQARNQLGVKDPPGFLIWRSGNRAELPREWKFRGPDWDEENKREHHLQTKAVPFDAAALDRFRVAGLEISRNWLAERSTLEPIKTEPEAFLEALYLPGERVMVFSAMESQGQWCYEIGAGWWRLGDQPGEAAEKIDAEKIPRVQRLGCWFLAQPVTGRWIPAGERNGVPHFTRRSGNNVTAWRYMVVESDIEGIEQLWLHVLVKLPLAIVALYTSGGRSVHALVKVDCTSKAGWDAWRDALRQMLTKLGADKGVFSAVRLTRLPGFVRKGTAGKDGKYVAYDPPRLQRLLFLNPKADGTPILSLPRLRDLTERLADG